MLPCGTPPLSHMHRMHRSLRGSRGWPQRPLAMSSHPWHPATGTVCMRDRDKAEAPRGYGRSMAAAL